MRPILKILAVGALVIFACEPVRVKTHREKTYPPQPPSPPETALAKPFPGKSYSEAVSRWRSYQDLVEWLNKDFSLDRERLKKFEGRLPPPRSPEETFSLKSGIYIDVATFAKETLNRMDPAYQARIVVLLIRPNRANHYVCSFLKDGMLFIIDYGTPYQPLTGIHGPFLSLEEFKRFFEKNDPAKRRVEAVRYLP